MLARRVIRWLITVLLPISYFYDLHYDSSRGLPLSWQRRTPAQLQNMRPKFLYLQILFVERIHWQKQSGVKSPAPYWWVAVLGTGLQAGSFCLAAFLTFSHSTMSSPELQGHSSFFLFAFRVIWCTKQSNEQTKLVLYCEGTTVIFYLFHCYIYVLSNGH